MRDSILKVAPEEQIASPAHAFAHALALTGQLHSLYQRVSDLVRRRGLSQAADALLILADELEREGKGLRALAGQTGISFKSLPVVDAELPREFVQLWEDAAASALVTAYRVCAMGVEDAVRGFAYYSHLAAHAEDWRAQAVLERVAERQLALAQVLRKHRRAAYHRVGERGVRQQPEVSSLADLRALMALRQAEVSARLSAVIERLVEMGESARAEVLENEFLAGAHPSAEEVRAGSTPSDRVEGRDPAQLLVWAQGPLELLADDLEEMLPAAQDEWRAEMEQALEGVLRGLGVLSRLVRQDLDLHDHEPRESQVQKSLS